MVICDHGGKFLYAATRLLSGRANPSVAKAQALRWAITEALRLELDTLVIETDSMEMYSCFLGKMSSAKLEPIIQDCRVFAIHFASFHLSHVNQGGK